MNAVFFIGMKYGSFVINLLEEYFIESAKVEQINILFVVNRTVVINSWT